MSDKKESIGRLVARCAERIVKGMRDGEPLDNTVLDIILDAARYAADSRPVKIPIPPAGTEEPTDVAYATGWNAACDAYFGGKEPMEPLIVTLTKPAPAPRRSLPSPDIAAAFRRMGGSEEAWLGEAGSWYTEGYRDGTAASAQPDPAPIDMVLHCPACGVQHIDGVEYGSTHHDPYPSSTGGDDPAISWSNPPHRSHLCRACGHVWRPADVPTNGVAAVATKGKADSPIAQPAPVPLTDEQDRALCEAHCNDASDEYFKARPQLDSAANRRIFYAGHRKGWLAHGIAASPQPAPVPLTDTETHAELWKLAVRKGLITVRSELIDPRNHGTRVSWMQGHDKACDISNDAAAHGIAASPAAPAAPVVLLTDVQILNLWDRVSGITQAGERRVAFARALLAEAQPAPVPPLCDFLRMLIAAMEHGDINQECEHPEWREIYIQAQAMLAALHCGPSL